MEEGVSPSLSQNGFPFIWVSDYGFGFSGSLFVSVSVSVSFYGGSNFPSFASHNGFVSREIDPLFHMKDPIPYVGFRSHFFTSRQDAAGQSSAVGVEHLVFLGLVYSHSSDLGASCVPGILLPKTWVPVTVLRSLRTPTMVASDSKIGIPDITIYVVAVDADNGGASGTVSGLGSMPWVRLDCVGS